jgi:hypothetical protein
MSSVLLLIGVACGALAFVFENSRDMFGRSSVIDSACAAAPLLCSHPRWLAVAAAAAIVLSIAIKIAERARG